MSRFLSAIAFLATLFVVLGAAGCGDRFARSAGPSPSSGDLAADALVALEAKGSAHFVADMSSGLPGGASAFELSLHAEGDASATALDAEGSVGFGAGSLHGRVMVDEHNVFIRFMNQWYGEHLGIGDALERARDAKRGQVWEELATPQGLRRNFNRLFSGEVSEGPDVDGVSTWKFEGHLNAEGLVDFATRFETPPTPAERAQLEELATGSRLMLVVGRDDSLLRQLEFSLPGSGKPTNYSDSGASADITSGLTKMSLRLKLSEFGKPVEIEGPASFKPLDTLFEQLFGGLE